MAKEKSTQNTGSKNKFRSILLALAAPEGKKSPYYDLADKYNITVEFCPFVKIEGVSASEFRKQKINIPQYSAVIFTSRHAIDHFFRICQEVKIAVNQETKYFCISEAVALYLQKFILYRKRKVFYAPDGTNKSLFEVLNKHKGKETFLYPFSQSFDTEVTSWLQKNNCSFATPLLYRVVDNDVTAVLKKQFDIICLFTPGSVKSLVHQVNEINLTDTIIATFGHNTLKEVEKFGYKSAISAPALQNLSMAGVLDKFLQEQLSGK